MSQTRCLRGIRRLQALLLLPAATLIANGQTAPAPASKLLLKAEVVLTPEFCSTKSKKGSFISGTRETFAIGPAACPEIEQALKNAFSSVTRVTTDPSPGATSAQLILVPKFVDIGATRAALPFSDRELVVLLEWTAKDQAGKPLWIEAVQGSARKQQGGSIGGNIIWEKVNRKRIIKDAVKDLAETSAHKMAEALELRKLVQ
jgi:hypothetical protein